MLRMSPKTSQKLAWAYIWGGGIITVMILLVVIGYVLIQGIPASSIDFPISPPQGGLAGEGGNSSRIQLSALIQHFTVSAGFIGRLAEARVVGEYD